MVSATVSIVNIVCGSNQNTNTDVDFDFIICFINWDSPEVSYPIQWQANGTGSSILVRAWVVAFLMVILAAAALPARAQQGDWEQAMAAGERALGERDFARAEAQFQAALEQAESFGATDPRKVETLVRLARLYRSQGDFAKPETLYREALRMAERALGSENPAFARYLDEVGRYYHTRRRHEQAADYYKRAFAIRVRTLGREHADVAESINNLAIIYENAAQFTKAEVYYEHALAIREKALGPDHLDTVATLEHFARLLHKMRRGAEAQSMEERARAIRVKRVEELASAGESGSKVADVHEATNGVEPPQLIEKIEPEYTEEARIARHQGAVILQIDITADGRAQNFHLLRSLGLGLDEKASEAVLKWRFKPARTASKTVAFRATMEIQFRLL